LQTLKGDALRVLLDGLGALSDALVVGDAQGDDVLENGLGGLIRECLEQRLIILGREFNAGQDEQAES